MRSNEFIFETADALPLVGFHITTEMNAKSIVQHGLEPNQPDTKDSHSSTPVVFLITNDAERYSVLGWLNARYGDDESEGMFTMLKINLTGLNLIRCNGFWCSTEHIPPNRITDLGCGSEDRRI
jgi:hypothetical protein